MRGLKTFASGWLFKGPPRPVMVTSSRGTKRHLVAAWYIWAGRSWEAPNTYEIRAGWNLRPAAGEGDSAYLGNWRAFLRSPVRLMWIRNRSSSRAWTGRTRELLAVDWWTPQGRRCWMRGAA